MKETKVQFSTAEMDLMGNSEVILTKNKVVQKVKTLLEELQDEMFEHSENHPELYPEDFFSITPKISKGENYLGLPYLILDYPRLFKQQDIFAIRTMFWWGNFFSTTLHLSGKFKIEYLSRIKASFNLFANEQYFIGVNTNPWLHHFGPDNYKEIALIKRDLFESECNRAQHLKIAKKTSLNDVCLQQKLFENWNELTKTCFV